MSLFPEDDRPKIIKTEIGDIVDPIDRFLAFIVEREAIRLRRAEGKRAPWSGDVIFRDREFCNVDREHDRTTYELAKMWRDPHAGDDDLWFASTVAREVNWIPTLEEIGYPVPWDADRFLTVMAARQRRGETLESSAYQIHADNRAEAKGEPKRLYIANRVLTPMWQERKTLRPRKGDTLDDFHRRLIKCEGIGGFIGAQIVADIKYVEPLYSAPDWWSFAASGPGSRRGLNLVLGRDADQKWDENDWRRELKWLRTEIGGDLKEAGIGKLDA